MYRTRKRSRVRSVSFRTLGSVCLLEAQYFITYPKHSSRWAAIWRKYFLEVPASTRAYRVERILSSSPSRRIKP